MCVVAVVIYLAIGLCCSICGVVLFALRLECQVEFMMQFVLDYWVHLGEVAPILVSLGTPAVVVVT